MRILGKDNGKHVVERLDGGEREYLTDAQLEKELDGMGKARASVTGLPPEFAPPAPKQRSAGVKVIGRDNGLNVIEVDGERKHVSDAELLLIKGGKAVTNALKGPPEQKDIQAPDEAKAQAEAAEKAKLEAEAKAKSGAK